MFICEFEVHILLCVTNYQFSVNMDMIVIFIYILATVFGAVPRIIVTIVIFINGE